MSRGRNVADWLTSHSGGRGTTKAGFWLPKSATKAEPQGKTPEEWKAPKNRAARREKTLITVRREPGGAPNTRLTKTPMTNRRTRRRAANKRARVARRAR